MVLWQRMYFYLLCVTKWALFGPFWVSVKCNVDVALHPTKGGLKLAWIDLELVGGECTRRENNQNCFSQPAAGPVSAAGDTAATAKTSLSPVEPVKTLQLNLMKGNHHCCTWYLELPSPTVEWINCLYCHCDKNKKRQKHETCGLLSVVIRALEEGTSCTERQYITGRSTRRMGLEVYQAPVHHYERAGAATNKPHFSLCSRGFLKITVRFGKNPIR